MCGVGPKGTSFIHSLTHSFTCYPGWLWIQVRETRQTGLPPRTPTPTGGLLPTGQRRSASGVMPALGLSKPQVPCLCNGAITALLAGHPVLAMLLGVHMLPLCPAPGCPVAHNAQVGSRGPERGVSRSESWSQQAAPGSEDSRLCADSAVAQLCDLARLSPLNLLSLQ